MIDRWAAHPTDQLRALLASEAIGEAAKHSIRGALAARCGTIGTEPDRRDTPPLTSGLSREPRASFVLDVVPVGKPRQTQRDRWAKRPAVLRYRAFADQLREEAARTGWTFPLRDVRLVFVLPMPASWSERKKAQMDGAPHESKPDLDNLLKAVKDALLPDDAAVSSYGAISKEWGRVGCIRAG